MPFSRSYVQKRADSTSFLERESYKAAKKEGINPNAKYDEREREDKAGQLATPASSDINMGTDFERMLMQIEERIQVAKITML